MNITILRDYDPEVTEGVMTDDSTGKRLCYTLELPWKNNQHEISCIPEGKYRFHKFASPKFGHEVYRLENVPNRDFIDMHNGNTVLDIEGCILVGKERGTLTIPAGSHYNYVAVLHSKPTLDILLSLLGSEGTITITSENGEPQ